jgi:RNA-directed DNA polymerase
MKAILSVRDLARRIGTPVERLREIIKAIESHYRFWSKINQKTGKVRHMRVPDDELKGIQRRLTANVLSPLGLGDIAHGGVRGRSARSNAEQHVGQPCVVTLDVKDFFPNVRHYMIYRMLRHELGFGRDAASLITRLTTLHGELPQGAPTSTVLANLILAQSVDGPLSLAAQRIGVRVTRFVDDITLSGANPRPLINVTARLLSRRRLPMYRKKARFHSKPKLRITPRSRAQEVTGLTINATTGLSIPRGRREAVRAAIFQLRNTSARGDERNAAINSIRGRIAHVREFNPRAAARLEKQLNASLSR